MHPSASPDEIAFGNSHHKALNKAELLTADLWQWGRDKLRVEAEIARIETEMDSKKLTKQELRDLCEAYDEQMQLLAAISVNMAAHTQTLENLRAEMLKHGTAYVQLRDARLGQNRNATHQSVDRVLASIETSAV